MFKNPYMWYPYSERVIIIKYREVINFMIRKYNLSKDKKYPIKDEKDVKLLLASAVGYDNEEGFKIVKDVICNRYMCLRVPIILY